MNFDKDSNIFIQDLFKVVELTIWASSYCRILVTTHNSRLMIPDIYFVKIGKLLISIVDISIPIRLMNSYSSKWSDDINKAYYLINFSIIILS